MITNNPRISFSHRDNQIARGLPIQTLSDPARRVLTHIRGRTITGKFACQLYNMPTATWRSALDELIQAGYPVTWTYGLVQDDPTVTGGYVLHP